MSVKTKILIVEDEAIVALDIKGAMKRLNFEITDIVSNHDDAINSVKRDEPDIILMDIHIDGDKDGIETAKDIQEISNIPILYLTAFTDDKTMQRAIETEPVAYLVKPFKREELKSTILLGLYKTNYPQEVTVCKNCEALGFEYYFDIINHILYYKNQAIKLGVKERGFLAILVNAKGSIVTFDSIENILWPDSPVSQGAIRTLIYRLRTKLEYKLIETQPSFGCRLTPLI